MQVLKTEVLNELYERTESRIKDVHYLRQLLIAVKSFEEFSQQKIKFTQFFFDIEDELREALQNAKSAYIEIKELKDNLELSRQRYAIFENKSSNMEAYVKELKGNIRECLEQMKFQDTLRLNNLKYIGELEKKILNLEQENKTMKKGNHEKTVNNGNNSNNISYNSISASNAILISQNNLNNNLRSKSTKSNISNDINYNNNSAVINLNDICIENTKNSDFERNSKQESGSKPYNKEMLLEKEEIKKSDFSNFTKRDFNSDPPINTTTTNDFEQNINNQAAAEASLDSSFLYKIREKLDYSQYNDIITERENSKKLINDFIKDSLNFNYNNNNNISESYNNFSPSAAQKPPQTNLLYNYNSSIINDEFASSEVNQQTINNKKNNNFVCDNNSNNFNFKNISKIESGINEQAAESQMIQTKITSNRENQKENSIKNLSNSSEKKIKNDSANKGLKNISNSYSSNNGNMKSFSPNRFSKADKILEIVIKIRTVEDISSIVYHLFGEDVLDKIISPSVDEELIEKVDATIQEIERLMLKGIIYLNLINNEI